ncbi:HugZ family protein [Pseudorhodobacter sp. MZDSW-24AT]|uniref:HugZ family pyridoxamine 5'-phosphate oxidase n=1 Tax=Pseudorhodobacter sp. MZDSW-24AT TaxID=2052957 RepID=UPI000C1F395A|nr:pyridoxamine 5-phosphate oxidase [Pseudorhodobacter sp. MZDSW-24AT]PJF08072.1 pyridoxamine 5-phosphate oxidase [Pseudorhodobacter sp. MZDSW-24AT]
MPTRPDPVAPADEDARQQARQLLAASHAALAYTDAQTGTPGISRIAFGRAPDGGPMTLISALAPHSAALRAQPACAVLLGEPGAKGDPLTHPRLMLQARAEFIAPDAAERPALRDHWLAHHPKAKLYIDFADFALVRLVPVAALLNGGFGRAFRLLPEDLA